MMLANTSCTRINEHDGESAQQNQYDGRGYRIVTKSYTSGTLSETRHAYFTDQWQCIEERLDTSSTPDRQFIWGVRYIDDLILRDRSVRGGTLGQPPAVDERLYALQYANWNVTTLTDSTGTVQERYEYDPYGTTTVLAPDFTVRSASNFAWETTYCGYRWDSATGLFAVRHRFYHPRLGVWLARDPWRGRRLNNLYKYVGAHPTGSVDPFGLEESAHVGTTDADEWFANYGRTHLGQPSYWYSDELTNLKSAGCVGISTLLLGYQQMGSGPGGRPDPQNLQACFKTLKDARDERNRMESAGECGGSNCYGESSQPRVIAILLRYGSGTSDIPSDGSGRCNMANWSGQSLPGQIPFDFGYYQENTGTFLHANQAETPQTQMQVYESNESQFRSGMSAGNLNAAVYCVMCERWERGVAGTFYGYRYCKRPPQPKPPSNLGRYIFLGPFIMIDLGEGA